MKTDPNRCTHCGAPLREEYIASFGPVMGQSGYFCNHFCREEHQGKIALSEKIDHDFLVEQVSKFGCVNKETRIITILHETYLTLYPNQLVETQWLMKRNYKLIIITQIADEYPTPHS